MVAVNVLFVGVVLISVPFMAVVLIVWLTLDGFDGGSGQDPGQSADYVAVASTGATEVGRHDPNDGVLPRSSKSRCPA